MHLNTLRFGIEQPPRYSLLHKRNTLGTTLVIEDFRMTSLHVFIINGRPGLEMVVFEGKELLMLLNAVLTMDSIV